MTTPVHSPASIPPSSEEDVDFLKWVLLLCRKWRWIVGSGVLFALLGAIFAYTTTPVYRSEAVIAPKTESASSRVLSRLGGLGGFVSTQIDAGNTPLDRLELVTGSRSLAYDILADNPELLPEVFPKLWDESKKRWKKGSPPNLYSSASYLRSKVLKLSSDRKKNILFVAIESQDPKLSARLVNVYLEGLNKAIRDAVRLDADSTRKYLENQMYNITDPQIRLKLEQLVAQEVEKGALVAARSFDLIEPAWVPRGPKWPLKGPIIAAAFIVGLFLSILGVIVREKIREIRANRLLP